MNRGEAKIDVISDSTYFGKVALEVKFIDNKGQFSIYFDNSVSKQCYSGILFGIEYVLEHIEKRKLFPTGGVIHILSVDSHEEGTNNVVIAFLTVNALEQALGVKLKKYPVLNCQTGVCSFPK